MERVTRDTMQRTTEDMRMPLSEDLLRRQEECREAFGIQAACWYCNAPVARGAVVCPAHGGPEIEPPKLTKAQAGKLGALSRWGKRDAHL